jgi:hypothetical protein
MKHLAAFALAAVGVVDAPAQEARNIRIQVTTNRRETGYQRGVEVGRPGDRGPAVRGGLSRSRSGATSVMDLLVMNGGRG